MNKVFIATSRKIGLLCRDWAKNNTPEGFVYTDNKHEVDIVISVMCDKVFSSKFLNNKRCYNFHPGILPEYKGVGVSSWVLINKEAKTGVTLHKINSGIDTGDIIEIREILIKKQDTAYDLHLRLQELMFKMFKDWYIDILKENYVAVTQDKSVGRVYKSKDLQEAKDLTNHIKAFYFPKKESAFFYNDKNEKIYIIYKEK